MIDFLSLNGLNGSLLTHFCYISVSQKSRSRLSYEQFSAFLANIKELNAQKQSREVQ